MRRIPSFFVSLARIVLLVQVVMAAGAVRAEPLDLSPLYLDGDALETGYRAFKAGRTDEAMTLLTPYIDTVEPGPKRDGATFLLAELADRAAASAPAAEAKGLRSKRLAWLSSLAGVRAYAAVVELALGREAEARGDATRAIDHYRRVPMGAPGHLESRLAAGRLLLRKGQAIEAIALCDASEAQGVSDAGRARLRRLRAEALDKSGRRPEAIEELTSIWRERFGSAAADEAVLALKRLGSAPSATDAFVMTVTRLEKGSRSALEAAVRTAKAANAGAGTAAAALASGVVEDVAGDEPRAVTYFEKAAKTGSPLIRGHALYRLGKLRAELGDPRAGLRDLLTLADSAPTHPLAGSALALGVDLARRARDLVQAETLLDRLARQYGNRSRLPDADWSIAWAAYQAGRYETASRLFRRVAAQHRRERHLGGATWGERGSYWEARCEERSGSTDRAADLYAELVRGSPLSYYSNMAYRRLEALDQSRAVDLRPHRQLTRYDAAPLADVTALGLETGPDLIHAAALIRLGLFDDALTDLRTRHAASTLSADGVTLLLSLMVRANTEDPARALRRWYGSLPRYPDDADERLWRMVYPLAYWSEVSRAAGEDRVSPWLVMALIRHESRYRPEIVSRARAVGLMQLLEGTARMVARGIGGVVPAKPTAKDLKVPAINIRLGVRFVRSLLKQFQDNEALVLAAYNAGPGRAKRFLLQALASGLTQTDELAEIIPYRETHSYVKSVLASYGVYRYVYGDRDDGKMRSLPTPMDLPGALTQARR